MLTSPDRKAITALVKDAKFDALLKLIEDIKERYSNLEVIRTNEFETIVEVGRRAGRIEAMDSLLNEINSIVNE